VVIHVKPFSHRVCGVHKNPKKLKKENLRDHMTNLELVLNMLAEASTTEVSRKENPKSFPHHRVVAQKGGSVAGVAKKKLEKETGRSVVGASNYLPKEKKTQIKNPYNTNFPH